MISVGFPPLTPEIAGGFCVNILGQSPLCSTEFGLRGHNSHKPRLAGLPYQTDWRFASDASAVLWTRHHFFFPVFELELPAGLSFRTQRKPTSLGRSVMEIPVRPQTYQSGSPPLTTRRLEPPLEALGPFGLRAVEPVSV